MSRVANIKILQNEEEEIEIELVFDPPFENGDSVDPVILTAQKMMESITGSE